MGPTSSFRTIMKRMTISNKYVDRDDFLAEATEFIKYESPFRIGGGQEISPGYGQKLVDGKWEPAKLPFEQGEILLIDKLDLCQEANDPRRTPTIITYFYHVKKNDIEYRFSSVYGHPYAPK